MLGGWVSRRKRRISFGLFLHHRCAQILRPPNSLSCGGAEMYLVSLPGLITPPYLSLRLKYAPAKTRSDAKIKKKKKREGDREECNYDELSRKKCLFAEPCGH